MSRSRWRSPSVLVRLLGVLAVVGLLNGCSTAAGVGGKQAQATEIQDQLVAIDGQTWVVGTHLVTVPADALVSGAPVVGDRVGVSGRLTESGELVVENVQVLVDVQAASTPARVPAEVPAQASGASATSVQSATDTNPADTVNSPAPQARPPAPESGQVAEDSNQASKAGKPEKGDKPGKGHTGN